MTTVFVEKPGSVIQYKIFDTKHKVLTELKISFYLNVGLLIINFWSRVLVF